MTIYFRLFSLHNLLFLLTLAFITGIVLSHVLSIVIPSYIIISSILVLVVVSLLIPQSSGWKGLLLLCCFLLLGYYCYHLKNQRLTRTFAIQETLQFEEEGIFIGAVNAISDRTNGFTRIDLNVWSYRFQNSEFTPLFRVVRFTLKGELADTANIGSILAIRAKLKKPKKYQTPGSFDYPKFLAGKNIIATGFIQSPVYIHPVESRDITISEKLTHSINYIRHKIGTLLDGSLRPETASIFKALLLGDRSSITGNVLKNFINSGCMHILAISGLHMSLLGVILYISFFWLLRRSQYLINRCNTRKCAAALCLVPLFCYTLLAGANIPVLRSFLMASAVIFAICTGKIRKAGPVISGAALIILIFQPGELFEPSFQLSFSAVISIYLFLPLNEYLNDHYCSQINSNVLKKASLWAISYSIITIAATLGTLPILLYHFHRISLVGYFTNLVVEPLLCFWALLSGLLAIVILPFSSWISIKLFQFGSMGIELTLCIVEFFGNLSFSSLFLPSPHFSLILTYFIFLLLLITSGRNSKKVAITVFFPFLINLMLLFAPHHFISQSSASAEGLKSKLFVDFLDVRHGSSTLIQFPSGTTVLVDGGSISSPTFDIGEQVIAPYLFHRKRHHIDHLIITHQDRDHYGGIPFIMRNFSIDNLWVNSRTGCTDDWEILIQTADKRGIKIHSGTQEKVIYSDEQSGESITVIENKFRENEPVENNRGLIIKVQYNQFSLLIPGDIDQNKESELIQRNAQLQSTILLAAHHGSATSNSIQFIKKVKPEAIIISSSGSRLGSQGILRKKLEKLNLPSQVFHTGSDGTISINSDGLNYIISTYAGQYQL